MCTYDSNGSLLRVKLGAERYIRSRLPRADLTAYLTPPYRVRDEELLALGRRLLLELAQAGMRPLRWYALLDVGGSEAHRHLHLLLQSPRALPAVEVVRLWRRVCGKPSSAPFGADGCEPAGERIYGYLADKFVEGAVVDDDFGDLALLNDMAVQSVLTAEPLCSAEVSARLEAQGIDIPAAGVAKSLRRLWTRRLVAIQPELDHWALRSPDYAIQSAIAAPNRRNPPHTAVEPVEPPKPIAPLISSHPELAAWRRGPTVFALSQLLVTLARSAVPAVGTSRAWRLARQFDYPCTRQTLGRHLRLLHRAGFLDLTQRRLDSGFNMNLWTSHGMKQSDVVSGVAWAIYGREACGTR